MSAGRKITDEHEARRCLAAAARRGQRAGAWAQANGIDGRSLNAWRMNLARRAAPRAARGLPAVRMAPRTALVELVPAPTAVSPTARYTVCVGAWRVEVGDDFTPATLRRLVEVLRGC